ncbi:MULTISPECIES: 2OG-Fe dioxygenase family protein [unclassified Paraburkholderia]|uniref:2OG-Fe dioxygenase family protein n=1 Tax=unclassified Paraburkholderia TaxID=2615204 RepID=UPI0016152C1C|nr:MULTISPECIES: 2OG-Fe dioxygenase family protein [unclassified Paraburkholderia]MBB5407629.1 hypothetical protein [Paraburkholderia sp. HC6.4b]MBB5452358.1 hypothetical protein [Paraburkholderia sp. Kb1A]MBC8724652.1 2OG-Fe dioxygenase family protein [Paraburkholderia sp. 31.1]
MPLNEQGFDIVKLPAVDQALLNSFDDLHPDIYIGNRSRFRRFSQYKMTHRDGRWQFELLPHRPYMTFSKYNKVAGGIQRHYEPLRVDFTEQIATGAKAIPLPTNDEWQINVHQYRVIANDKVAGVPVPEGPHQDGHDFVMIAVMKRHDITGAEMSLLPLGGEGEAFFKATVQEGEAALLDDRQMFHYVTDIEPIETEGHRDIFVIAFSRWADRWHGEDFERKVATEELKAGAGAA